MAAIKDKDSSEYVQWANEEIQRIKALPQKLREGAPQLFSAAQKLMARHDYGQAAQLLQQIPPNMRPPEADRLLGEAIELQDEADLLLTDLKDCVATRTYDGIEDNVKRLLELKPGNQFAREVWEALQTYQKIPRSQRNYRFDSDGNLQPHDAGLRKAMLACSRRCRGGVWDDVVCDEGVFGEAQQFGDGEQYDKWRWWVDGRSNIARASFCERLG